jgi:S-(hydroxymethyl)glutathione dehydrogenase/alcohol dehydrogenase
MVRAVVVREAGGPWCLESVRLPDIGRGQVRVRVRAVGLCRSDLSLADGSLRGDFPVVPGHEGVGTVEAVGPDVVGLRPGDPVLFFWTAPCGRCWFCVRGEGHLCDAAAGSGGGANGPGGSAAGPSGVEGGPGAGGGTIVLEDGVRAHPALGLGAFAEELVTSARAVRPSPISIPDEQAAVLGCAVATGFGAVRNTARVAQGDSVVVVGTGGVGLSVIQTARDVGAGAIFAVDPAADRRDLALRLGAHAAYPPDLTLGRTIRAMTGGHGADHVFECVGKASAIRQAWGLARRGGQVVVVGAGSHTDRLQFSAFELFHFARTLRGAVHGSFVADVDLPLLCERVAAGAYDLPRLVARRSGLDGVAEAVADMEAGRGARSVFVLAPPGAAVAAERGGASEGVGR